MAEEPMMDENKKPNDSTESPEGIDTKPELPQSGLPEHKPGKSRRAAVSKTDSEASEPAAQKDETVQPEQPYDYDTELAEYAQQKRALPSLWNWFMTFLIMDLPVAGIITLIIWSFGPHTDDVKRGFARARLLYRIIFLGTSVLLLWLVFRTFLPKVEELLNYLQKM